jgi:RNA polymerase sigma-70 factor (ECF subfamily)
MDQQTTALVLRARQGSDQAVEELFATCGSRLLAMIRIRLGRDLRTHLESRDILQATLLKAFVRFDQVEAENSRSLMAWLARIAENEIYDQVDFFKRQCRDAARTLPLDDEVAAAAEQSVQSQVSRIVVDQQLQQLEAALEMIDEHYREVILLRKFHEMSFPEIGQRLGKSPDACRMLLARAMVTLTLKMKAEK